MPFGPKKKGRAGRKWNPLRPENAPQAPGPLDLGTRLKQIFEASFRERELSFNIKPSPKPGVPGVLQKEEFGFLPSFQQQSQQ